MKCLVINLDRSAARLAHMTAEFDRVGVAFERVVGVDGANLPELAKVSPRLSLSEIACFLSHQVCWRIIAKGDHAYGAIFEDDAVLTATAGPLLADTGWIPADADVIKLETFFEKTVIGMRRASAGHGFSVARLYGDHLGTGGYIISRQAAQDLVEATRGIEIPVDNFVFESSRDSSLGKTIYQLLPALCTQGMFLHDKATELSSVIDPDRPQKQLRELAKRRKKTPSTKIANEAMRIGRQIFNAMRMRRAKDHSIRLSRQEDSSFHGRGAHGTRHLRPHASQPRRRLHRAQPAISVFGGLSFGRDAKRNPRRQSGLGGQRPMPVISSACHLKRLSSQASVTPGASG